MSSTIPDYLPSLGRLLGFANQRTSILSTNLLRGRGITLKQWIVLTGLWQQDGMTVKELSEYSRSAHAATSKLLGRMEAIGLVQRKGEDSDNRVVRIWLGDEAKKLDSSVNLYKEVNDFLLQGFSEEEASSLFTMLERIIVNAESTMEEMDR